MSTLEFVIIACVFVSYTIFLLYLLKMMKTLEDYIMAQKDITAFNQIRPEVKKKENIIKDEKKEKEKKEWLDYTRIIDSGICDDKDIDRFGTKTVDQG